MSPIITTVFLLFVSLCSSKSIRECPDIQASYLKERDDMINKELKQGVGGEIELNQHETLANEIFMKWKYKELSDYQKGFNLSKHYFSYQKDMEKSQIYQLIKKMPKGAVLHVHSSFMMGTDYLVKLTYEENLYVCFDDAVVLKFSDKTPQKPCLAQWQLMSNARNQSGNITDFDRKIKNLFSMFPDGDKNYDKYDIDETWNRFEAAHETKQGLLKYRPILEKYFYDALQKFYDDNISYIEIRSGITKLYEFNGTEHDVLAGPRLYQRVACQFVKDHPDFVGIKLIVSKNRLANHSSIQKDLNITQQVKKNLPDIFAGFDLVGQEDKGKPLVEFMPLLKEAQKDHIHFYFHGGETNWYGYPSDENLVDAILLGSKRIGHAYALMKHPLILKEVKKRDIAIEVNVISNNVLALVKDIRNHPLSMYLAMGLPVVLSSDDPGAWDAEPLSHDFYVAFMGVANRRSDLRLLKQLALNSIEYSALNRIGKNKAFRLFKQKWDMFILYVINELSEKIIKK